jgi:hypothetical protein
MKDPGILKWIRVKLAGWLALHCVLGLLAVTAAVAAGLVLVDAAVDLPEATRLRAPWFLASAGLLVVIVAVLRWSRLSEHRLARDFEYREPNLGNRLTNAVQLLQSRAPTSTGEFFRREALALGRETASRLKSWRIVRGATVRALVGVAFIALLWGWTLSRHELTDAVFPRFLDPRGDHPPYSTLKIDVQPAGGDVLFGGQLEVRALTRGRPVDKLWVITRTPSNETRAIMFLAPDKSFFQTLANLREPAEYFVTDGQARSRRFPVRIRYTPQITLAELSLTYPDYTSKPPRTSRLSDEPLALPEGTRIRFRVASNRPLQSGTLHLTPVLGGSTVEVPLQPDPGQGSVVSGEFSLSKPVSYSLAVRDIDGLASAETRRGRFNIAPDERPRLHVLEPGRNAVATPSIRIPVKVEAQDDYGVTRVVWLRGHNRSIERPLNMKLTLKNGAQAVESAGALELAQLGVRPGDVIDYYFEAADNDPKGPNLALSRIYRLEIISDEQYEAILRQAAARKALFEPYLKTGAWLRRMAEQARDLEEKARAGDPAASEKARALDEQMEQYLRELGNLLRHPAMFDVEQSFRTTLVEQHTLAGIAREKLKQSMGKGGQLDPKPLKEAVDTLSRLSEKEEEQVGEPARQIVSVVQVLARADYFVRLAQQQAALAQILRRFSDRTDGLSRIEQMEVQELTHAQGRIRDGLQALVTQLPDLLKQVPAEPAYDSLRKDVEEFLKALAEAKIQEDLSEAAKVLTQPDTMTGYALAQQAAVKMDKLISKCSGLPDQGRQCLSTRFQPKLNAPGLGNSVAQILAAMGQGKGQGQGGEDGFGLFNEDVALYGPNVELAGEQAGGRREGETGSGQARHTARVGGKSQDTATAGPDGPGRVRLQPDARFPLRYRELVGEYFRAIAETETGGTK